MYTVKYVDMRAWEYVDSGIRRVAYVCVRLRNFTYAYVRHNVFTTISYIYVGLSIYTCIYVRTWMFICIYVLCIYGAHIICIAYTCVLTIIKHTNHTLVHVLKICLHVYAYNIYIYVYVCMYDCPLHP